MPLREDLLEPVAGVNPSGANLYYDKLFDQIKDARTEEVESGSAGAWERAPKRADHILVIKLTGDALAKHSKDLRLAGWLIESSMKREGIGMLSAGLDLLLKLQETFWGTLYPEVDEDGDLGLRVTAVEGTATRLSTLLRNAPINKAGHGVVQYNESQRMGYEKTADTKEKKAARQDCIDQGQVTPEDFDAAFAATSKGFYVSTEESLGAARTLLDELDRFNEEKYGDDYPALNKLATAIDEVKQVVAGLLNEKRKTEPDLIEVAAEPEPVVITTPVEPAPQIEVTAEPATALPVPIQAAVAPSSVQAASFKVPSSEVESVEQAGASILAGALYLQKEDAQSPSAYLTCSGVRLGETRRRGASAGADFAVAPATEIRQTLRKLANEARWDELTKECLKTLTEPCGRAWLDLHRYIWRAARESGFPAIATAVVSTIRGLLVDLPEVRTWMLDDDTPVANAETQTWIDTEIFPPPPVVAAPVPASEEPVKVLPVPPSSNGSGAEKQVVAEIYDTAIEMLKRGKAREAITLLVRDAELQPSGRSRFQRRVQVAQLCLVADQDPVAYPVLMELSQEIERRNLETWETGEMLAHPLSLLLTCLDRRKGAAEHKEAVFERLCRLDPQAAMAVRR